MAGAGAWGGGAASPQDNTNSNSLDDIMSEQLASHLQRKEDIRFAKTTAARNILPDEGIPEDLVQHLQTGPESEFCDSDLIIAQMLQCQFDQEYQDQIKNSEKKRNGLYKYKIPLEHSVQEAEEDTAQREHERDWDNFDDNEKDFAEIPRCGYKLQDGKMVTKHDTTLTGRRNACKVMAFPPEFRTGDGAAFDMQLPNRVFNSLKAHSRSEQSKKNKMLNRKESHATAEMGIDEPTRLLLYKFINNGMLQSINGIIATGKESIVLHAEGDPSYPEKLIPNECAIKVFKTTLNEFKTRDKYIKDDYRFKDRFCKLNPRKVIHMWAEKEMHNLMRMQKLGINCPEVIYLKKHILILSFIGKDNMAAQKIKEAKLTDAQWILAYEEIVEAMNKMYNEGHLIHADLSEYNILWHEERCWFIDVSQSVEPNHPSGLEFLLRDCTNISHFFSSKGVPGVKSAKELFEHITGIQGTDLSQLERMRYKGPPAHKLFPTSDGEQEEVKPPTYPFDYAWEKSQRDKKYMTKDNVVHHDGLRDDFDELWKKSQISKDENLHEESSED